jgi:uncharacterized surface protein with fasciclin (FAS1) repeats
MTLVFERTLQFLCNTLQFVVFRSLGEALPMSLRKNSSFIGKLIALAGVGAVGVWTVLPATAAEETKLPGVSANAPVEGAADAETPTEQVAARSSSTIAELASSSDSFETLTAALEAAGLTEVLQGEGPYTVFAPTDEAFEALPAGTLEELLKPENRDTLIQVLTYHVVPGEVTSSALSSGDVATVEGSDISVTVGESEVNVNDATVVQPDVLASNGVIHVIDQVILPPSILPTAGEAPAAPSDAVTPEMTTPSDPTVPAAPAAPSTEETVPANPQ